MLPPPRGYPSMLSNLRHSLLGQRHNWPSPTPTRWEGKGEGVEGGGFGLCLDSTFPAPQLIAGRRSCDFPILSSLIYKTKNTLSLLMGLL